MTDFTGTDLSGIYNPYMSQYNLDYLSQILEAQGYTLDQIATMSQDQINSLVSSLVQSNTGSAPTSDVFTGGSTPPGQTAPPKDTTGLPMGYVRLPTGQVITEAEWEKQYNPKYSAPPPTPSNQQGMDQQSAAALGNMAAGGSYRQDANGVWHDTTNGNRPWNPNEGMPQDIVNAYMLQENPYLMSGGPVPYTDHLDFKDPTTGEARPVPASIQALAADPNTDIIAMEDGYYLSDPVNGTTSKYAPDGSVVYETKVDPQGNYVTSYASGARSLVTKNGWRTDYDATGKVLVHKYQGDPRPSISDLKNSGDPRARMASAARLKAEITSSMQAKLGQVVGPDGQVNRAAMPQNPGPHTLPSNPIAGRPATGPTTVNAQFGGLGYSGPVPGQPATPASNGVPQNPALGSIDWNDKAWKQKVMPDGSVQTVFEPDPNDPRFDLTGGVDYLHGQSWQDHERDAQAARSSQAGDLQASGTTDYMNRHPIPPDDTPGYGNNPPAGTTPPAPGTIGTPAPTPPGGSVTPPPPHTTQPPVVRPPVGGPMPPTPAPGTGEVRAMPYPGRPTPPTIGGPGQGPVTYQGEGHPGGYWTQIQQQQMMTEQAAMRGQQGVPQVSFGAPAGMPPAPASPSPSYSREAYAPAPAQAPAPQPSIPTIQPPVAAESTRTITAAPMPSLTSESLAGLIKPYSTSYPSSGTAQVAPTIQPPIKYPGSGWRG